MKVAVAAIVALMIGGAGATAVMERRVDDARVEAETLQARAEARANQLSAQLNVAKGEVAELKQQADEAKSLETQLTHSTNDIEQLTTDLDDAYSKITILQREIVSLSQVPSDFQAVCEDLPSVTDVLDGEVDPCQNWRIEGD